MAAIRFAPLLLTLIAAACAGERAHPLGAGSDAPAHTAPDWTPTALDGKTLDRADTLASGRSVMLVF